MLTEFARYVDDRRDEYVALLQALLRQPSISADGTGIGETSEMVRQLLTDVGADAQVLAIEGGHPVVHATLRAAAPAAKTLGFYNHYDVQPAEPLDLWASAPFAAEIRDGRIWARGSADNKGNLMARICAVSAYRHVYGDLPLALKFIVEGEEEVGSPHLEEFAATHRDLVAADACIWEGGYKDATGRLIVYCGVKGMLYVQLSAGGAREDLHSMWAAIVPSPAWELIWALGTLKDARDRILIPGFYDRVRDLTADDRAALRSIPFEASERAAELGIAQFVLGLQGVDLLERYIFQPTCNVCGLAGGYQGPGIKTVLPNRASVKIDFRLVPDQDPREVLESLRQHLAAHGHGHIRLELLAAEMPARTDLRDPLVETVIRTVRQAYGRDPIVYPMVPGTGPMYVLCQRFGIPSTAGPGVSHPGSLIHAPNENIYVDDYIQAITGIALLIHNYAQATR